MATRTNKRFRTGIAEAVHEMAGGLHRIGLIDQKAMREFDASCLTPIDPHGDGLSPLRLSRGGG
jgi:putative transcriptional regulator